DRENWAELGELYLNYQQLHPNESPSLKPKIVAALDRAAGLKPQNLLVIQRVADAYRSLGEFERAETFYLELRERCPGRPGPRERFKKNFLLEFLPGVAHGRAKEYREAVRHFTEAEVIAKAGEPDSLTYLFYFQFGSALERNGDYAEAEKYFRKCRELSPHFAE